MSSFAVEENPQVVGRTVRDVLLSEGFAKSLTILRKARVACEAMYVRLDINSPDELYELARMRARAIRDVCAMSIEDCPLGKVPEEIHIQFLVQLAHKQSRQHAA